MAFSRRHLPRGVLSMSVGVWVIVLIAIASSLAVALWPVPKRSGIEMWTFARAHAPIYQPAIAQWNDTHFPPVHLFTISEEALANRMMSGFLSHTPVADLIEVERTVIGRVFAGPLADVGFVDLTERIKKEGGFDELNEPSFSAWTSRGHIFGLPHDVHPVMLAYRADIVEAAGIDVSKIETWDDFVRVMSPLLKDKDHDGQPDHYPLNIWYTAMDQIEVLILQAGGNYFNEDEQPVIDSDANARVIATVVSWTTGPHRIAADAPEFTGSGNKLRLDGYVVCSIAPDWLTGWWKTDLPQLRGKMKLMPLPAWTRGGCHTGVWGGTMLGISKTAKDVDQAWEFAHDLYLNDSVARRLYEADDIISPVKRLWKSSFYDAPDPYFSGQPTGRLYIKLAPFVPRRTSSPYNNIAKQRVQSALIALRSYAIDHGQFAPEQLLVQAHVQLHIAQTDMQRDLDRNVFRKPGAE
jgi:arabinosaccharide transport system substrate-binding protein